MRSEGEGKRYDIKRVRWEYGVRGIKRIIRILNTAQDATRSSKTEQSNKKKYRGRRRGEERGNIKSWGEVVAISSSWWSFYLVSIYLGTLP